MLLLSLVAALAPSPMPPVPSVQPGGTVSLSVRYQATELLNRRAPNTLTLVTPWQQTTVTLTGPAHPGAQWADYFASVRPAQFELRVPLSAKKGLYHLNVAAQLFICNEHEQVCQLKKLSLPLTLWVAAPGPKQAAQTLSIRSQDLGRSLWP